MNVAIECENLKRTYTSRNLIGKKQENIALHDIHCSIPKGIVFGLLGPNGSGKTTTIRILSTLLTPTAGKARVLGYDVVKEASRVRGRIGLILGGERGLYGRLTGEENLKYFAALNNLGRTESHQRVKEIIKLVGLTEAGNRKVEQYSRGMRQRLHIGRSLMTDPDVIFMDEPTIGLDPQGAQELRHLVPDLVSRGKTILLTTHYMLEADELCSMVAIINHGKIVVTGSPLEIKKKFSKINVIEAICRSCPELAIRKIKELRGIDHFNSSFDGPLQKLSIHVSHEMDIKTEVVNILGDGNIESIVLRDPTLEEAYLSILK
jgi:ABC-2 type transport system ATP-binding protein